VDSRSEAALTTIRRAEADGPGDDPVDDDSEGSWTVAGDGKADLTVFRHATAEWFQLRSRDGARAPVLDAALDEVDARHLSIPADYEEGGHSEEALSINSGSRAFALRPGASDPSGRIIPFGLPGVDVAVVRPLVRAGRAGGGRLPGVRRGPGPVRQADRAPPGEGQGRGDRRQGTGADLLRRPDDRGGIEPGIDRSLRS
jgi:hypothetical protein